MGSLRKIFAICEVVIGIIGIFLFITGPFFMFLLMPFGITAMVLGFAGVFELKSTKPGISFLILLILSICYIIVFPYRGVGGLGFRVPRLVSTIWPFFNVIAVLPRAMKSIPLILLTVHLFLIAFEKNHFSKMVKFLVRSLAIVTVIAIFVTINFGEEISKQIAIKAEGSIKSSKLEVVFESQKPINNRYIVEKQQVGGLDKVRKEYLNLKEARTFYFKDNQHIDYPPIIVEIGIFEFKDNASVAVNQYDFSDQHELTDRTGRPYGEFISKNLNIGDEAYWRIMDNKIKIYVQKINVLAVVDYPVTENNTTIAFEEAIMLTEKILENLFGNK